MHRSLAVAALVLLISVCFYRWPATSIRRNGKRLPRPPGTLPIIGNGLLFLRARHKLLEWAVKCEGIFGLDTFEISVPSLPPGIVINDPRNLEFVLKEDAIFTKGEEFRKRSWDLFGNGIINADGQLWKTQRKAGLRFFSNANLMALIDEYLPIFVIDAETTFENAANEGKPLDLQYILTDITTRLMGRMAYGQDMYTSDPFFADFECASAATGKRFQNPLWRFTEFFIGARLRKANASVHEYGSTLVATAKFGRSMDSLQPRSRGPDSSRVGLIDLLLDDIEDPKVVADAALNFLSAGRDTTAQALTWTFYLLSRHPRVVRRIREEVDPLSSGRDSLILSFPQVQPSSLPYVLAVFYESLRLYPPVPVELKQAQKPSTLPDGTFLPAGSIVVWCPYAMGRSRTIWGGDAAKFRPERWLEDIPASSNETGINAPPPKSHPGPKQTRPKHRIIPRSNYEFPVFNGGPRTCLGRKMAELQAVYVIAKLIFRFDFEEVREEGPTGGWPLKERISRNSLTLPMEGGLPCYVKMRRYHS